VELSADLGKTLDPTSEQTAVCVKIDSSDRPSRVSWTSVREKRRLQCTLITRIGMSRPCSSPLEFISSFFHIGGTASR
jgi:hypothetical protein